jgi:tetratricopeptide (TPR) repeat protein
MAQEARQRSEVFALAFHLRPLLLTGFRRWRDRPHDSLPFWAWRPPLTLGEAPAAAPQAIAVTEAELRPLLAELDRQVRAEPEAWEAWAARGWCRHLLGDAPGAVADLKQAADLRPDEPGLWALRGTVYLKQYRLHEAEAVRQRLAGWPGVNVAVWHTVEADVCQAEGALTEAHWHLGRLLEGQAPPSPALLVRHGLLCLGVAPSQQEAFTQTVRGGLLLRAGKFLDAAAELQKAALQTRGGEAPVADLLLAVALHGQGKTEEGRRLLERVLFVLDGEPPLQTAAVAGAGLAGPLPLLAQAAGWQQTRPRWDWPTRLELRLLRQETEALLAR